MHLHRTDTDGACKARGDLQQCVCVDGVLEECLGELIGHKAWVQICTMTPAPGGWEKRC